MKFTSKYILCAIISGVCSSSPLVAQQVDNTYADIDYISKSNTWLNAKNAAGLKHYNTGNISNAELYLNKTDGGFRNFFQSNNSMEYGLRAQSYTRLNKKIVLAGGFEYQNFKGKNMGGSVFMDPYQNPFDIVELDAANRGTKETELYHLNGAVSAQVTSKLSFGGKLNYSAANYSKRRDLRHVNKLLDMDLSAGALYEFSKTVSIGANYTYNRRIESLTFKAFGNIDKQFQSLISYGSFYGRAELFDKFGYTSSEITNPLKDIRHGGALQLGIKFSEKVSLFNEFSYEDRNGFFGEEGTSTVLLTQHQGTGFGYNGRLSIQSRAVEHHIGLKGNVAYLENDETIYRRETSTDGINRIVYYGNRPVFSGQHISAGLSYDLYLEVMNNRPKWAVSINADYLSRDQSTNLYPFYRDQKLSIYQLSGQLNRHYQTQKDAFNIGLGLGYGAGKGDIYLDGIASTPAESYMPPATVAHALNEEYEYLTANRVNGKLMFQYTRAFENKMSAYVKLNYLHTYAADVQFLGKHLNTVSLSLGTNF